MKKLTDDEVYSIYRKVIGSIIALLGVVYIIWNFFVGYQDFLSHPERPHFARDVLFTFFIGYPIFGLGYFIVGGGLIAWGAYLVSKEDTNN